MKDSLKSLSEMNWKLDKVYRLRLKDDPLFTGPVYESYCLDAKENSVCLIVRKNGKSVPIHNPQLAMILETREIGIYNAKNKSWINVDGTAYLNAYIKGFEEGEVDFDKRYGSIESNLYGNNATECVLEICNQYYHVGRNDKSGWDYGRSSVPKTISQRIIYEYGYYTAHVFCADNLMNRHRIIFDKILYNDVSKNEHVHHDLLKSNAEKINAKLVDFGFFELAKVKVLSAEDCSKLIGMIVENQLSYVIAMFDFLGFIRHLDNEYFKLKGKRNNEISKWFQSDKDGRAIRGYINSLSKKPEGKDRYKAYLHKEKVQKDYQRLKKGVRPH
ncbi:MAG: hypothetical protein ABJF11_15375 [Reichenbachiella sp.]|uniref:hypothetical protein n=1 Tax=Reichenbachiella sp. TaxID=2184521 RepID=UPI00326386EB